jgi:plastocyanin
MSDRMPNASGRRWIGALGLVALAAGACGGGGDETTGPSPNTPSATVTMTADRFLPDTTTISAGGTVAFVNGSGILHDVDFGTPQLHIAAFSSGSRSLTFPTAGTLHYFCNLHAGMEATLIVH